MVENWPNVIDTERPNTLYGPNILKALGHYHLFPICYQKPL